MPAHTPPVCFPGSVDFAASYILGTIVMARGELRCLLVHLQLVSQPTWSLTVGTPSKFFYRTPSLQSMRAVTLFEPETSDGPAATMCCQCPGERRLAKPTLAFGPCQEVSQIQHHLKRGCCGQRSKKVTTTQGSKGSQTKNASWFRVVIQTRINP